MCVYYTEEKDRTLNQQLPYITLLPSNQYPEATSWCIECFGHRWHMNNNPKGLWGGLYYPFSSTSIFHFRNKKDFLLFQLKWL